MWPGSNATAPGADGVGQCKAIKGFAKWSREILIPGCKSDHVWYIAIYIVATGLPDEERRG